MRLAIWSKAHATGMRKNFTQCRPATHTGDIRTSSNVDCGHVQSRLMRLFRIFLLSALIPAFAQTADEKDAIAAAMRIFDAIAAHDPEMVRAAMLPDARVYYVNDESAPGTRSVEEMASRVASTTGARLERFTSPPKVMIHGRIAQVWGEYEFLVDGKFNSCGVDSFSLFKTSEGWRIAAIAYAGETKGCKGR
jgi:hypothetical protein